VIGAHIGGREGTHHQQHDAPIAIAALRYPVLGPALDMGRHGWRAWEWNGFRDGYVSLMSAVRNSLNLPVEQHFGTRRAGLQAGRGDAGESVGRPRPLQPVGDGRRRGLHLAFQLHIGSQGRAQELAGGPHHGSNCGVEW